MAQDLPVRLQLRQPIDTQRVDGLKVSLSGLPGFKQQRGLGCSTLFPLGRDGNLPQLCLKLRHGRR